MNPEIARQVAEILASMSIDEIRALVAEIEMRLASPEIRLQHVLRPLADMVSTQVPYVE